MNGTVIIAPSHERPVVEVRVLSKEQYDAALPSDVVQDADYVLFKDELSGNFRVIKDRDGIFPESPLTPAEEREFEMNERMRKLGIDYPKTLKRTP